MKTWIVLSTVLLAALAGCGAARELDGRVSVTVSPVGVVETVQGLVEWRGSLEAEFTDPATPDERRKQVAAQINVMDSALTILGRQMAHWSPGDEIPTMILPEPPVLPAPTALPNTLNTTRPATGQGGEG